MKFQEVKTGVCEEIRLALDRVDEAKVEAFVELILSGDRIFVIGAGRVMLMMQAFAKRLRHLGIESYVVGETTVPSIGDKDVLIAGSGSGETLTTVNVVRLAKKVNAKVALITSASSSTLKELADLSVRFPCPTKLHLEGELSSKQLLSSLFEQSLLIFCDSAAMILKDKLNISEEDMWKTHSNLE